MVRLAGLQLGIVVVVVLLDVTLVVLLAAPSSFDLFRTMVSGGPVYGSIWVTYTLVVGLAGLKFSIVVVVVLLLDVTLVVLFSTSSFDLVGNVVSESPVNRST